MRHCDGDTNNFAMTRKNNRTKEFIIKHRDILICLFLIMATGAVYWQVPSYDFVNYDDNAYVTENQYVKDGLTSKGIVWAFTTIHEGNWHPLTWLSHMLDCQLYGLNAGWHHLTNLLFHIANTVLLFMVFRTMTGDLWPSGFVAVLFAIHPLHVESVAWIAERKDVLSAFFWLLTMGCYLRWVQHAGTSTYLTALLLFGFGLLAKPMVVTLPFVLLLLDYWPLNRLREAKSNVRDQHKQDSIAARLVWEKTPFFVMAAIASAVTLWAEKQGGAVVSLDMLPFKERVFNTLISYVGYILKTIWPGRLAVFYPYPAMVPLWQVAGACLLLVSISLLAIKALKQKPYFIVGWLWYLGTLVPVIGLVQIGRQAMADRYTYLPLIGLFVIVAWGIPELVAQWRSKKIWLTTLAIVLLSTLMVVAWKQVGYWKNDLTLFEHALKVTPNNYIAHNSLGATLAKQGRTQEAVDYYLQALRIKPDYVKAHYNLAVVLLKQNRIHKAIRHFSEAVRLGPDFEKAHLNLGNALLKQGRMIEAVNHYFEAIRIKPDYLKAYNNLSNVFLEQGLIDEAIEVNSAALKVAPDSAQAHYNLGAAFLHKGHINKAVDHFRAAVNLNPGDVDAKANLKKALKMQQQSQ